MELVREIVTVDPLPLSETAVPLGAAAPGLRIRIVDDVFAVVGEMLSTTVATTPSANALRFIPETRHRYCPVECGAQTTVFKAADTAGAIDTLMLEKSPIEYPISHCSPDTWPFDPESEIGRDTLDPGEPDPAASERVALNAPLAPHNSTRQERVILKNPIDPAHLSS